MLFGLFELQIKIIRILNVPGISLPGSFRRPAAAMWIKKKRGVIPDGLVQMPLNVFRKSFPNLKLQKYALAVCRQIEGAKNDICYNA